MLTFVKYNVVIIDTSYEYENGKINLNVKGRLRKSVHFLGENVISDLS